MNATGWSNLKARLRRWSPVALAVALAAAAIWASTMHAWQWDWTAGGRHSLSEESRALVRELEGTVRVTVYAGPEAPVRTPLRDLMQRFARASDRFDYHFVDPRDRPRQAREHGVTDDGAVVVHYEDRIEVIREPTEETISRALYRLAQAERRWIVFVTGHGERNPVGEANHDLGTFAGELERRGYTVQQLNLSEVAGIPPETALLVLAGPQTELMPGVVEHLRLYLDEGGNFLWLTEPQRPDSVATLADHLGLSLSDDPVVDPRGQRLGVPDPAFLVLSDYPDHPATGGVEGASLLPRAAAVTATGDAPWASRALLQAGSGGRIPGTAEPGSAPGADEGRVPVAVTLTRALPDGHDHEQRIAVVGDGDFLSNAYVANGANLKLGLNLTHWLTHDDAGLNIPPRASPDPVLELPRWATAVIGFGFLIALPVALAATGAIIGWRRRRR